jgi:hypothetical protein
MESWKWNSAYTAFVRSLVTEAMASRRDLRIPD